MFTFVTVCLGERVKVIHNVNNLCGEENRDNDKDSVRWPPALSRLTFPTFSYDQSIDGLYSPIDFNSSYKNLEVSLKVSLDGGINVSILLFRYT